VVIEPVAGLDDRQRRRAARVGPPGVSVRTSYTSLLQSAGFANIETADLTVEFRQTQQAWIDAFAKREHELIELLGADVYAERRRNRTKVIAAIDDRILRRTLYVADRP
jgi:hypothetical protein